MVKYTLSQLFGCGNSTGDLTDGFMIDVDTLKDSEEFEVLLGYINTLENKQLKGDEGSVK